MKVKSAHIGERINSYARLADCQTAGEETWETSWEIILKQMSEKPRVKI
jgi:hypothetical protein